ncbi:cupin domain-containing protein [Aridibaculum aurantiacum]|uniref:cupin domain-containing protein n=1 Tax=Aridibaculum aurantiacum TaxID=2810307 RepID=UPI001A96C130|nr:cupin domain-containing protein [Aridibaculum aurantiacum]
MSTTTLQSSIFQVGNETAWENLSPGISRQIFGYDDKIMLVKVKFDKDAVGSLHEHHHSQVTYVEAGVFEVTIGDENKILKAGDGFYVPPHAVHGCVCLEPGMLVDVFSPHREDFLAS